MGTSLRRALVAWSYLCTATFASGCEIFKISELSRISEPTASTTRENQRKKKEEAANTRTREVITETEYRAIDPEALPPLSNLPQVWDEVTVSLRVGKPVVYHDVGVGQVAGLVMIVPADGGSDVVANFPIDSVLRVHVNRHRVLFEGSP